MPADHRWPDPGDTPLDAARTVARHYRAELLIIAPDRCAAVDQWAIDCGQTWATPALRTLTEDDYVEAELLADVYGIRVSLIHLWASRHADQVRRRPVPGSRRVLYRVGDILAVEAERRIGRIKRARKP